METKKIKELIALMNENDLSEIEIVDGQTRIMLKRGRGQEAPQVVAMPSGVVNGQPAAVPAAQEVASNLVEIVSPIVGTFHLTPSPNAEPFVQVGSTVQEDTVVCIVEAMKVMNEIKSEVSGTIKEVLVKNGQAVEYGQKLFTVEPG